MNAASLIASLPSLWLPPEKLTLSQWAERNFVLSSEYSARSGPIKLFAYQRAIFDSFSDPTVKATILMCSTQMTKSLLMQAATAWIICEDPAPILIIQPKDESAKKFSKRRIAPMLKDCPILQGKVSESGAGKDTTIQEKSFPGGSLSIVGAGSPINLASASVCYLMADEVDKYENNVGNHGNALMQAKARLSTYGSRAKIIEACSPTDEYTSQIARDYQASDQRQPWIPCHACGHFQVLKFGNVRWDNTLPEEQKAGTAHYECENCGAHWNDLQRWKGCDLLEWRAQKPFAGIAGFWCNHLISPWHKLSDIVGEFLRTRNDWTERKTFINNSLAELWKVDGISPDDEKLFARRESYPFNDDAVVPSRAVFLTAAVDVQANRLECEVRAWGRNKESWSVAYEVIQPFAADGKTPLPSTAPEMWAELDKRILLRDWPHEDGGTLPILLMTVDCGFNAQTVYEYCLKHPQPSYNPSSGMRVRAVRSVVPIRGDDNELKIVSGVSSENAARKRQNVRIVSFGTHAIKSELYDILRNVRPDGDEPVANCIHFPMYEMPYFASLCSEHRIVKPSGKHEWQKKPNARNEGVDLASYNRGGASLCGIERFQERHWLEMEAGLNKKPATKPAPADPADDHVPVPEVREGNKPPPPPPPLPQRPQRRTVGRFF